MRFISKQSVEGVTWFLLPAYCKIREDRGNIREGLSGKNEAGLAALGNPLPILDLASQNKALLTKPGGFFLQFLYKPFKLWPKAQLQPVN